MKVADKLRIALPCILIFGAIGALAGGVFGDAVNGIRAGIVVGGGVAYVYLQRKNSGARLNADFCRKLFSERCGVRLQT